MNHKRHKCKTCPKKTEQMLCPLRAIAIWCLPNRLQWRGGSSRPGRQPQGCTGSPRLFYFILRMTSTLACVWPRVVLNRSFNKPDRFDPCFYKDLPGARICAPDLYIMCVKCSWLSVPRRLTRLIWLALKTPALEGVVQMCREACWPAHRTHMSPVWLAVVNLVCLWWGCPASFLFKDTSLVCLLHCNWVQNTCFWPLWGLQKW